MLTHNQKQKLMSSWGDKADALACLAEIRLYDPLSFWQCYLYALNPEDENEVDCIVKVGRDQPATTERWFLSNIFNLFNRFGEGVEVDIEYRPQSAFKLLKKLNELKIYDTNRH